MIRRYRNKLTEVAGVKYASKAEARRAEELALLQRSGAISELKPHPAFPMVVNGQKVCTYNADFQYRENGELVVEDVKSPATRKDPVYRIKVKLLRALYGIDIREVA